MFENVRADLRAAQRYNTGHWLSELFNPGTQAVLVYRFGHWSSNLRIPVVRHILMTIYLVPHYFVRAFFGVFITTKARIGPGLLIHTWGGIFVPPIEIGRDFVLQQGAMINWHCRGIGDDVVLGPGCKIGPDLRIGSRVRIGPNVVVTEDVPDDATVTVLPPRMLTIQLRDPSDDHTVREAVKKVRTRRRTMRDSDRGMGSGPEAVGHETSAIESTVSGR